MSWIAQLFSSRTAAAAAEEEQPLKAVCMRPTSAMKEVELFCKGVTETDILNAVRVHMQGPLKIVYNTTKKLAFVYRECGENNPIAFSLSRKGDVSGAAGRPLSGDVYIVGKSQDRFFNCTAQDVEIAIAGRTFKERLISSVVSKELIYPNTTVVVSPIKEEPSNLPLAPEKEAPPVVDVVLMVPEPLSLVAPEPPKVASTSQESSREIKDPMVHHEVPKEEIKEPEPIISPSILRQVFGSSNSDLPVVVVAQRKTVDFSFHHQEEERAPTPENSHVFLTPEVPLVPETPKALDPSPLAALEVPKAPKTPEMPKVIEASLAPSMSKLRKVSCVSLAPKVTTEAPLVAPEPVVKKRKKSRTRVVLEDAPPPRRSARLSNKK